MRACPGAASAFIAKATHSALVHATSRSLSTRRNHWSSWFQLAKIWVADAAPHNSPQGDLSVVIAEAAKNLVVKSTYGE